jgi:hypothetical protein
LGSEVHLGRAGLPAPPLDLERPESVAGYTRLNVPIKMLVGIVSLAALVLTPHARPLAKNDLEPVGRTFRQALASRIAFTRTREDVDREGSDYRLEAEIWMMNSDGGEAVRLTT